MGRVWEQKLPKPDIRVKAGQTEEDTVLPDLDNFCVPKIKTNKELSEYLYNKWALWVM